MSGFVHIKKNGLLVDRGQNGINTELMEALMSGLTDKNVTLTLENLFQNYGVSYGGSEDGNDGILFGGLTMKTTFLDTVTFNGNQETGVRWRGELTNSTSSTITGDQGNIYIGKNFNGVDEGFQYTFASYSPASPINLEPLDSVQLTWQINVTTWA